jgi:hypothetical protein
MNELKLNIELVPSPLWGQNPRKLMARSQWDKLRRQAYSDYAHKCGICNTEGQLECHERWKYDDENHIQILVGFIALCSSCHSIKHLGNAGLRDFEGTLGSWVGVTEEEVVKRVCFSDLPKGRELFMETDDGRILRLRMYQGNVQMYESRMDSLASHFMDVNECSRTEFEEHRSQARSTRSVLGIKTGV